MPNSRKFRPRLRLHRLLEIFQILIVGDLFMSSTLSLYLLTRLNLRAECGGFEGGHLLDILSSGSDTADATPHGHEQLFPFCVRPVGNCQND